MPFNDEVLLLDQSSPSSPSPRRGGHGLLLAAAVTLVLVVAAGLINSHRSPQPLATIPEPVPTYIPPTPAPMLRPLALPGAAIDLASSGQLIYVLTATPSRLFRLRADEPTTPLTSTGVDTDSNALALDGMSMRLWLLRYAGPDRTDIAEYDPLSLSELSMHSVPLRITSLTAFGERLWLVGNAGLFVIDPPRGARADPKAWQPRLVLPGPVSAVAPDLTDGLVIAAVAGDGKATITSLDAYSARTVARRDVALGNVRLAAVFQDLWVAGVSPDSNGALLHLRSRTLRTDPDGQRRGDAAPIGIWPGTTVVWMTSGERTICLRATTGTPLLSLPAAFSPVVPGLQGAYGILNRSVHAIDLSHSGCYQG